MQSKQYPILAATLITYWPSDSIDQVQAPNKLGEIYRRLITKQAKWSAQLISLIPRHGTFQLKERNFIQ